MLALTDVIRQACRMAELYLEQQIDDAHLPGFREEGSLDEALEPDSAWQSVLSLTVVNVDEEGSIKIFDAIRREDMNPTHPGVVSTPTARVPTVFAKELYRNVSRGKTLTFQVDDLNPQRPIEAARFDADPVRLPDSERVLTYLAASLLAGKLGCAQALEAASVDKPLGTVSLETILAGFSYASETDDGEPLFEPLLMFGVVMNLFDRSAIPSQTEPYRHVNWISLEDFRRGNRDRDPQMLVPSLPEGEVTDVCVRGLCLATSLGNIANMDALIRHAGIAAPEEDEVTEPEPTLV